MDLLEGNPKRAQILCDLTERSSLLIGSHDRCQLRFCNALYLQKPLRLILQDVYGLCSEFSHDRLRCLRPYPLDEAGTEVGQYAFDRSGRNFPARADMKLEAVFRILPFAIQLHIHSVCVRHPVANRREGVPILTEPAEMSRTLRGIRILRMIRKYAEAIRPFESYSVQFTSHLQASRPHCGNRWGYPTAPPQ